MATWQDAFFIVIKKERRLWFPIIPLASHGAKKADYAESVDHPHEFVTSFILHSMQMVTTLLPSDAGQKLCFPCSLNSGAFLPHLGQVAM